MPAAFVAEIKAKLATVQAAKPQEPAPATDLASVYTLIDQQTTLGALDKMEAVVKHMQQN